jgi:predicted DNA binding CopG/RHH family protein
MHNPTREYLNHGEKMIKLDDDEKKVLEAYEAGQLQSIATKSELEKTKTAARATGIKDRRVNIRLSSGDLNDIQSDT